MSAATKSVTPLRPAAMAAAITPPVGPDPSKETARLSTDWGGMTPPLDCIKTICPSNPDTRSCSTNRSTYAEIFGATYALTNVVEVRSNSGARGRTSWESEMWRTSGYSSRINSRARRSWSGFTKLKRKHTAIDSTPSF